MSIYCYIVLKITNLYRNVFLLLNASIIFFFPRSPTHAGGLFAINREYFLELGAYDPGLLVWGGENFELSFKVYANVFSCHINQ